MDDATGTVAQAVFRTTEDTRGYLVLLEGLMQQWGIPLDLYSYRRAAFKYNARKKPVPTETIQFDRVMRVLDTQQINALSSQSQVHALHEEVQLGDPPFSPLELRRGGGVRIAQGLRDTLEGFPSDPPKRDCESGPGSCVRELGGEEAVGLTSQGKCPWHLLVSPCQFTDAATQKTAGHVSLAA